jgi:hypothetical protein
LFTFIFVPSVLLFVYLYAKQAVGHRFVVHLLERSDAITQSAQSEKLLKPAARALEPSA